jgi:glycosyltransferase involved in cell wall biosynthesis
MNFSSGFCVSHPTGNTFVRALLYELWKQEKLVRYFTTIGVGLKSNPILKLIEKKRGYALPDSKINRQWFPELLRLVSCEYLSQEKRRRYVDRSYGALDQLMAKTLPQLLPSVIHAYEDGAMNSFRKAKELGIHCSYELPIAHWKTVRCLLSQEAERLPEWEPTLESTREPEEKLYRKEEELDLADSITCPSKFVFQSIPENIRKQKACQIAPFGSPKYVSNKRLRKDHENNILRLLFIGSMSQRKGLADLFDAMKILRNEPVSLTVLGQPSKPMEFYRNCFPDFEYLTPRPNESIRRVMLDHDALVLPSIVEGRALVQQEALACGLPILVTANAGGVDLIEEGITGYVVSIRSPEDIVNKISLLIESRKLFPDIRKACINKAASHTWQDYSQKIIAFNLSLIESNSEN